MPGNPDETMSGAEPDAFDTSVAHIARVYNFWLGGRDNYAADQVSRFFAGVDLVEPGLVQLHRWRPGPEGPVPATEIANYGAVGRKP